MPGLHRFLLYDGFGLSTAAVFAPVAGAQRCRVFGSSRVYAMLFWQGISPSSRDSSMCLNLPFVFGWGWFQDFLFWDQEGEMTMNLCWPSKILNSGFDHIRLANHTLPTFWSEVATCYPSRTSLPASLRCLFFLFFFVSSFARTESIFGSTDTY